jgi:hypothetical protein
LIIKQLKGECSCNDPQLVAYLLHAQKLEKDFEVQDLHHIPRVDNAVTDDLSTKASTWAPVPDGVFERRLLRPTAWPTELGKGGEHNTLKLAVLMALLPWSPPRIIGIMGDSVHPSVQDSIAQVSPDAWIMKIWDYLKDNIPPDKHASTERIVRVAKQYTLVEGDLSRCDANDILLWCITQEQGCELLVEIHGGECDNHALSHTVVGKAFQHGFYWSTALQDAVKLVKRCRVCHFHAKHMHTPAQTLQMIPPSWSFAVWALDILGPFPRAIEGYRYMYVAINKFTKCPEATLVVKINKQSRVKFTNSIVCRFGVPNMIITDNGS